MRRFFREEDGAIYDRRLRRFLEPETERRAGAYYVIDEGRDTERRIPADKIEEVQ